MTTERCAPASELPNAGELWQRLDAPLRAFVFRRVSPPESAEDILQDIYLKIHTKLPGLCNPARADAWVFQIARNTVTDYYRSRERLVELHEELPAEQEEEGGRELEADLRRMVRAMIGELPPIYRQALAATDLRGMRQAEAARKLGLSLPGLKSRVQRGRRLLKKMLFDCCRFHFDRRGQVIDYQPRCDCR